MKIIRSKLKYNPSKGETPKGVSLTVPDDSYTVQELLAKHEAGLSFGIQRLGQFDLEDDDDHDAMDMQSYQNMDITEKELLHRETSEIVQKGKKAESSKKQRLEAEKAEKAKKEEKPQS